MNNFDVVPSLKEYTEHILYACKIINSEDRSLEYSIGILSEPNFKQHQEKMEYLRQYSGDSRVKDLIVGVEKRINEFKMSKKSIDKSSIIS